METKRCPECGSPDVFRAPDTGTYHCRTCKAKEINPFPTLKAKRRKQEWKGPNPYPAPPDTALDIEIVTDHYQSGQFFFGPEGFTFIPDPDSKRLVVSKVYCPKVSLNMQETFNPHTNEAQTALAKHRKRFKNRRRYQRDLERRALNSA